MKSALALIHNIRKKDRPKRNGFLSRLNDRKPMAVQPTHNRVFSIICEKSVLFIQNNRGGAKDMFSLRNKRRLVKKSENLNKYGPFFIIFPLPVMLKFTVHLTAVHLFTCVAKAVTSRRSRELK